MRIFEWVLKGIGCGLLAIGVASCAPANPEQVLTLRLGAEPSILNPILAADSASMSVNSYLFNGLLAIDENMELVPDLAQSYTVSDDGLTITFQLHQGVTWHDGAPFTAHDVLFTYQRILDTTTNTVRRSDYIINNKPIQFELLDTYRLAVHLPQPFAPILYKLTMGILPKHRLEGQDINVATFNHHPIGTGPFRLKTWQPSQFVLLEKNPQYFKQPAQLEYVLLSIMPDQNSALISFEKEELLSCGIPAKDVKRLARHPLFDVHSYYNLGYTFLAFNCDTPLFQDQRLRQAINRSINKEAIVAGILLGYGGPASLPTSPEMWTYPSSVVPDRYQPQQALEQLQQAGYTFDAATRTLYKDGRNVAFKIITNKGNKDRERAAVMIMEQLKDIGITVSIQLMEWSSFVAVLNDQRTPKQFDAVLLGWNLGLDPDMYTVWHSSQYPKGFNFIGYRNQRVDQLLEQGRTVIDVKKRQEIYRELYTLIRADQPYVFLYYPKTLVGVNKRVGGLSDPGPAGLFNPIESVFVNAL